MSNFSEILNMLYMFFIAIFSDKWMRIVQVKNVYFMKKKFSFFQYKSLKLNRLLPMNEKH